MGDEKLLEKVLNAANSEKFRQLWIGDTSGYRGHSEADQAQMERLFEQSGLVREKWRNCADYRERTIREAIRGTTEFYEPADG